MTFLLSDRLIFALGWAVLHALWMGTVIGLTGAVVLSALRRRSAATRYRAAYSLLMLFFTSVAISGGIAFAEFEEGNTGANQAIGYILLQLDQPDSWQHIKQELIRHCNERLPWVVSIWMIGLILGLIRLGGGYWMVRRIRRCSTPVLDRKWQQMADGISQKLGLHRVVTLAESAMIQTPVVAGHIKPIIMMPLGMLLQLQPNQVEAILAHELAHVLRRDYLLNIVQSVIEALLYFHPTVWWLSGVIRREREHCCDDLAIHACGTHPLVFAKALVSVQEHASARPQLTLALGFASRRQQLLFRVQRILQPSTNKSNKMERSIASMLLLALITCISLGANTPARAALATVKESLAGLVYSDTTPTKKKMVIKESRKFLVNDNGKEVEMTLTEGKIEKLVVDGTVVPEADYGKYTEITDPLVKREGEKGNEMREMRIMVDDRGPREGSEVQNRMIIVDNNDADEGETVTVKEEEVIGPDGKKHIVRTETRTRGSNFPERGRNFPEDRRAFIYRGPEGSRTIQLNVDDDGLAVIRRNGVICDSMMTDGDPEERVFGFKFNDGQLEGELGRLRGLSDDIQINLEPQLREIRIETEEIRRDAEGMVRELRINRGGSIEDRLEEQEDLLREQRTMLREQERRLKEQERELKRLKKEHKKG